jgi:glycosyltransferase involved in cell wall biosynthesis
MSPIDLIVLTYNEELNLDYCLRSVQGLAQNIFVVDSGSTDRTVEIAHQYGAQVVKNPFTNQAQQFNWALDNLPIQSDWILRLDADEYLLPELRDEILYVLPKIPDVIRGLYMKRRMIFLGKWIRHGGYYPIWLLRLFRYGKARSEQIEMDEQIVLIEGKSGRLKNDFVDHNRKGLSAWTLKHEAYATRQAYALHSLQKSSDQEAIQPNLFGNSVERKRWLKRNLYGRTPFFYRAFLYFGYRYFLRFGFLDGLQGLIFHFLHACWYLFYVDAKIYEKGPNSI